MKTKNQKIQSELRVQSSNHHSEKTPASAPKAERPPLANISFAKRRANRLLTTERVLQLLQREAPNFFNLAEVVGIRARYTHHRLNDEEL